MPRLFNWITITRRSVYLKTRRLSRRSHRRSLCPTLCSAMIRIWSLRQIYCTQVTSTLEMTFKVQPRCSTTWDQNWLWFHKTMGMTVGSICQRPQMSKLRKIGTSSTLCGRKHSTVRWLMVTFAATMLMIQSQLQIIVPIWPSVWLQSTAFLKGMRV